MIFRAVGKQNISDNAYCPISYNGFGLREVKTTEGKASEFIN